MANENVVSADLNGGWSCVTAPLWQWDYGQVLEITGIDDLPSSFVAHCANRWDGSSQTVLGSNGRISIPNDLLTSGEPVYVWIVLTADGTDGETKYKITIPVNRRAAPTDYPTTAQQSAITQAINALNTAAASAAAEVAENLVDDTLSVTGKAADAAKVGSELSNLKSDLTSITEFERLTPNTSADSYRLKTDGNSAANSLYNILKYYVSEGQKIYIVSKVGSTETNNRGYQFQDRDGVPTSGNESHVVGTPSDTDFSGYVTVPSGARTLCISALKTDTQSGVYSVLQNVAEQLNYAQNNIAYIDDRITMLTSGTRLTPTSVSAGYALNSNGVSEVNTSMRILKYAVTAGSQIKIFARQFVEAVYQFQNSATVGNRTENPSRRVGDTICVATAENITVPEGATYIIINDILDGDNGLFAIDSSFESDNVRINPNLYVVNLIAHKGGSNGYDGSVNRLKYSYEHGYKILEMDVQFTSDGVPVIHHDSTIMSGGETITISSTAYADLINYDLGDGSRILSLDDAVLFCKKRGLIIEIDMSNITLDATRAKVITDIVINRGMLGSTIFTGVPTKQALITALTNRAILSVSNLYDETTEDTIDAVAEYRDISSAVICSINHSNITEALVNYAHQKGLIVKTWTHTNANTVNSDLAIGVDLAICDNIYPDSFEILD